MELGIHGGKQVALRLAPRPAWHGRSLRPHGPRHRHPGEGRERPRLAYATTLRLRGAEARTVEHLMAAVGGWHNQPVRGSLAAEVPILDGSALPFVEMIRRAGFRRPGGQFAGDAGAAGSSGSVTRRLDRAAPSSGAVRRLPRQLRLAGGRRQRFVGAITPQRFRLRYSPGRALSASWRRWRRSAGGGLGLGGSLDNCIVVDRERILSGDLRFRDEFVRHKVLDLIGDLALLEYPLRAQVVAHRAGHSLQRGRVNELLASPEAWELLEPDGWRRSRCGRMSATRSPKPWPQAERQLTVDSSQLTVSTSIAASRLCLWVGGRLSTVNWRDGRAETVDCRHVWYDCHTMILAAILLAAAPMSSSMCC